MDIYQRFDLSELHIFDNENCCRAMTMTAIDFRFHFNSLLHILLIVDKYASHHLSYVTLFEDKSIHATMALCFTCSANAVHQIVISYMRALGQPNFFMGTKKASNKDSKCFSKLLFSFFCRSIVS